MTRRSNTFGVLKSAAIIAALFVCAPVAAQEVTLTSRGGNLTLTGRVIGFDGTYLQIESPYGPLTVDLGAVRCEGDACPDPATFVPDIRLSGDAAMAEVLIPALIEGFARARGLTVDLTEPEAGRIVLTLSDGTARFAVHATTSEEGFADLVSFQADMALSQREVRADERARAVEIGIGQLDAPGQSRIVGFDALVPVVAPTQIVSHLSLRDLSRAFRGNVTNWVALGGEDVPISLHLGPATSGQVQFFVDHIVRAGGRAISASVTYHPTLAAMSEAVARDPGGLGMAPLGMLGPAQVATLRDGCGFVAVPRPTSLKSQDYPLTAPLFIYLPEWRLHPVARDFLTFLRSPDAQLIVRRAGFVDQGPVPIPLDSQGQRFANAIAAAGPEIALEELQRMVRVLGNLVRQSVSFRFEVGSTRLDAASRSHVLMLAQAIRDGGYDGRTLWLIGFTDGRGDAAANRDLSSARAEAVLRDLTEVLGDGPHDVTFETEAFGEALPMACDDTEWGRQMNRRVELWVSE